MDAVIRVLQSDDQQSDTKAIDVIKVGYWFERLLHMMRKNSAYAVGQGIRPDQYRKTSADGAANNNNLWAKYATGAVCPGPYTVQAADKVVPGSAVDLALAAWTALNVRAPIIDGYDSLLRRTLPKVQHALLEPTKLVIGRYVRRASLRKTLTLLECHSDINSIAALVILLREAHEAGDHDRCFEIGQSLYATVLMASYVIYVGNILPELIEFLIRRVFPLASSRDRAFDIDRDKFCSVARRLESTLLMLEDIGTIDTINGGPTREWRKVVKGHFGFDHKFAFAPGWKLARPPEECSESAPGMVASRTIAREWALEVLSSGRVERLIPKHIIEKMAAVR
ncbi:MAG: hypothetical protein SGI99_09185 [Pseudomonadota bacterium]|nr:hypothetical protein [Pseudomonadota bacterium]